MTITMVIRHVILKAIHVQMAGPAAIHSPVVIAMRQSLMVRWPSNVIVMMAGGMQQILLLYLHIVMQAIAQ